MRAARSRLARRSRTAAELVPGTWAENVYSVRVLEVRRRRRCPDTVIEIVYEPLASPGARFGRRFPLWPAEFKSADRQASQFTTYLGEASPGAHQKRGRPDNEITWVDCGGEPE